MKNRLVPKFGAETRFKVSPIPAVPFRETQKNEFEKLQKRLLKEVLSEKSDPSLRLLMKQAVNEAAGVAWLTPFPMLFFPVLVEELAEKAARQERKQREVRWISPRYYEEALS